MAENKPGEARKASNLGEVGEEAASLSRGALDDDPFRFPVELLTHSEGAGLDETFELVGRPIGAMAALAG